MRNLSEGKTECLVTDGKFNIETFNWESLAQDEFFTELRLQSVEHLGQVRKAYLETSGEVSIYYYDDDDVKYGLPITPDLFVDKSKNIESNGIYACSFCGNVDERSIGVSTCDICGKSEWVAAIKTIRKS